MDTPMKQGGTRKPAAFAAAAAAVALVASVVALSTRGGDQPTSGGDPISPGGMASCVELYSLETLANRDVAFDGTVRAVSGDKVTFAVREWFVGGEGDEVTLSGASSFGGMTSVGGSPELAPGARLLVAGDGGFAWGCGFTQPYDDGVASSWRKAFS